MEQNNLIITLLSLLILVNHFDIGICWTVEVIPNTNGVWDEAPHWRYPNLYLAGFNTGEIKRIDTIANVTYACQIEGTKDVSFIIPQTTSDSLFVVGLKHNIVEVSWDGVSNKCPITRSFFAVETTNPEDAPHCLTDGKCDANGRLFTGTANCNVDLRLLHQHLYKFYNGRMDIVRNDVNISNGMTWNSKNSEFYHIDTGANTITRFKYDLASGTASSPETVFKLNTQEFPPNNLSLIVLVGITIDTDGNLFVTVFGGKHVLKISTQTWQILERYEMPCAFISSGVFGGPNMDIFYVASASSFFGKTVFPSPCGKTFAVTGLGVQGVDENACTLN